MADVQKLQTPLVESAIKVEPGTPPQQPIFGGIRRVWSMMFGRRENTLQPVYADRAGMLGVVSEDLNGYKLAFNAAATDAWTDMGAMMDLVFFAGLTGGTPLCYVEFGPTTGTVQYLVLPKAAVMGTIEAAVIGTYYGSFRGRARWFHGVGLFGITGRVVGYTAPKR